MVSARAVAGAQIHRRSAVAEAAQVLVRLAGDLDAAGE
jgi:hypothetical protein